MNLRLLITPLLLLLFGEAMAQKPQGEDIPNSERAKSFIDHIAPKMDVSKSQKDSLITIFTGYMDDLQKYRAGDNEKLTTYLTKVRDDKVKSLLHNDAKYDKYLIILADFKKEHEAQQGQQRQPQMQRQSQHRNRMGPTGVPN